MARMTVIDWSLVGLAACCGVIAGAVYLRGGRVPRGVIILPAIVFGGVSAFAASFVSLPALQPMLGFALAGAAAAWAWAAPISEGPGRPS